MGIAFVDMLGFGIIFPLLPYYTLRLGADPWVVGALSASFSVAQLSSAPLWGRFSDRYGRRPTLLIGLGASAAAFVVFGLATTIWMLFLSRLVQGIGGGITGVAQAYIGDAIEPKQRAKALGWLSASTSAGVMLGPAIGSLSVGLGYAAPGLIAAGLCLLNIVFAWKMLPESQVKEEPIEGAEPVKRRGVRRAIIDVVRHPGTEVSQLIWIYAVGMLGFMSMTNVLALYLDADFGITERTIGLFFVYVGALSVLMRAIILGKVVDRFGEIITMRAGAMILATGLLSIGLAENVFGLIAVISLVPIGTALLFPSVSAVITHRAERRELGQTLGVQQSFGGVSRVVAPLWSTWVFQEAGHEAPFYIAAGIVAVVVYLSMRVKPAAENEREQAHLEESPQSP